MTVKKIDFFSTLYFVGLFLYFFFYVILIYSNYTLYFSDNTISYIRYFIYGIFLIKIAFTRMKKRDSFILLISLFFSFCIYLKIGDVKIFEMALIIFASKNIKFEKVSNFLFYEILVLCSFVVISSLVGKIPNYQFYKPEYGRFRYSLGFTYVIQLPALTLELLFLKLYINQNKTNKKNIIELVIIFIILVVVCMITIVRNVLYCGILMVILYIISKRFNIIFNIIWIRKVFKYIFLICFFVSVIVIVLYDSEIQIFKKLDSILSTRLELTKMITDTYDVRLLGNKIDMHGSSSIKYGTEQKTNYLYIDNLYFQLLYRNGLLCLIAYLGINTFLMSESIKENKYHIIAIWIFIMAINSLIADIALNVTYNCSIIMLFELLDSRKLMITERNSEVWKKEKNI